MNLDKLALVENSLFEFSLKLSLCLKRSVIDYLPSIYLKTFSLTKICHGTFDLESRIFIKVWFADVFSRKFVHNLFAVSLNLFRFSFLKSHRVRTWHRRIISQKTA